MSQHTPAARHNSPWAIASLICSLAIFCPLATMLGPAMGVKAIADIRAKPGVGGGHFAVAGIVLGLLATFGWIMGAMWWDRNIRQPILTGPEAPLQAGFHGNIGGFKAGFYGRGSQQDDVHATAFINELTRRYGQFHNMTQAPLPADASPPEPGYVDPTIRYVLTFDRATVHAEVEFVVFPDEGLGLVGKWRSIVILDDECGTLSYPP